jgi:hypothetical protein
MTRLLVNKRLYGQLCAAVLLAFALFGCNRKIESSATQSDAPTSTEVIKTKFSEEFPRSIKVSLTVSRRSDLKVKVNSKVIEGDVLTDRAEDRNALLSQRKILLLSLARFEEKFSGPKTENLPPQFYDDDKAKIRKAEVLLSTIAERIEKQKAKILEVEKLNLPSSVLEHERAKLGELEQEATNASAEINLTRAQFLAAQEKRKFVLFEIKAQTLREVATEKKESAQLEINAAQIRQQIAAIDEKLLSVAVVRSPFPAVVERIVWEGQKNNEIFITLHLVVDDSGERAGK